MRFDRQYRYLYMNPAGLRTSKLREDQIIGKNLRESGFDEPLVLEWERKIQQVFDTGEPVEVPFSRQGAEGQVVQDLKLMPDFDRQGSVKSVLGVSRSPLLNLPGTWSSYGKTTGLAFPKGKKS